MTEARIYQPSKTAAQSGRAGVKNWVLEYEMVTDRTPESLMGWVASGDTLNQVRLKFSTFEEAKNFAEGNGLRYSVQPPHQRRVRPRNYADNFKYIPVERQDS